MTSAWPVRSSPSWCSGLTHAMLRTFRRGFYVKFGAILKTGTLSTLIFALHAQIQAFGECFQPVTVIWQSFSCFDIKNLPNHPSFNETSKQLNFFFPHSPMADACQLLWCQRSNSLFHWHLLVEKAWVVEGLLFYWKHNFLKKKNVLFKRIYLLFCNPLWHLF